MTLHFGSFYSMFAALGTNTEPRWRIGGSDQRFPTVQQRLVYIYYTIYHELCSDFNYINMQSHLLQRVHSHIMYIAARNRRNGISKEGEEEILVTANEIIPQRPE